ncbi:hypothetical protein PO869_16550, partial [[Ruminococcus] gnavus]|nr:hypothetical protein [Mediterraneibacter gnavus]MDE1205130.1 hypothetical protein [Mediterraneibacter gnavus]
LFCGDLTILLLGLAFHCFVIENRKSLCHSLGRPSRSDFVQCEFAHEVYMKSIEELEKYLEDECYSFVEINIGKHHAHEGIVIEKNGDAYEFGYSERGNKRILMSFSSEQELVEYALEKLKADKWNKAHLVAWVWSEAEIQQAEAELKNYNISFERNDVPNYLQGKNAYRIFVFGKDYLKLEEFTKRYYRSRI